MNKSPLTCIATVLIATCTLALTLALPLAPAAHGQWTQWGGPGRDFVVQLEAPLATWGDLGPTVRWLKPLGPGYSGIVVEGDRLYTMTRQGAEEVIVALSAADGADIWRRAYAAPTDQLMYVDRSYGDAPQATPMVAVGHVYGLGFTGILTAVDAERGTVAWSHNLAVDQGAGTPYFGHAASPLRVGDTVVVLAGGARAFDLRTGALRWQNREFTASYASPILVQSPAGEQLVAAVAGEVVGLSLEDGRLLWRHEHANRHKTFLNTPTVGADGTLFASAYFLGSIGLRLGADGKPEKLWELEQLQISQSNAVTLDNMVVASHNRNLMAVDLPSGEILWRERGVGRSNLVQLGSQALLLDDRGRLTMAKLSRSGFERLATVDLLEGRSWTAPTVVGSQLFARNGTEILAVDLSSSARTAASTAAGLRGGREQKSVAAPTAFTEAVSALESAARRADGEALGSALEVLASYEEQSPLAPYVYYARGFAAWQRSLWGPEGDRLQQVDRGVEALQRALDLEPHFVEAHALMAPLYSSYYRFRSPRASVVGQLGDEHLAEALERGPENPRVMTLHALDLIGSPAQYGGDPERGKAMLVEAIRRFDAAAPSTADPGPRWGPAMARVWLAQELLKEGNRAEAHRWLKESLRLAPDFALARKLLERSGQ